jgi:multicomponent Na+:H+ antiporter subunit D
VGRIWDKLGIMPLMTISGFWSWFDWHAIDGVVDGVARGVKGLGGQVRRLQSGQIQYNIYFAATVMAVAIIAYVFA